MIVRTMILAWVVLAAGGCAPASDVPGAVPSDVNDAAAKAPASDAAKDAEDEERRRIAVWLQVDTDHDGLTNGIELEFGLNPEDPTDGPDRDGDGIPNTADTDIDGDGIPNSTDVDIDGDGIDNSFDPDTDGDMIPDRMDTDDDGDGVRDRWDWDADWDGDDDNKEKDKKKGDDDDDKEEEDRKLNEAGAKMAEWVESVFGTPEPPESEELKAKYHEMATWVDQTFGGGDVRPPEPQALSEPLRRFGAMISQLAARGESGDTRVLQEMRWLLMTMPLKTGQIAVQRDSTETRLVIEMVSDRYLGGDDESRAAVGAMVDRLAASGNLKADISDALDVLFQQALLIANPQGRNALADLDSRIAGVVRIVDSSGLKDATLATGSDAIRRLAGMRGEGTLDEKVDALVRVAGAIEEKPAVGELVGKLEELTQALDKRYGRWSWDAMADALESAPDIEDGIDAEVIEHVVNEVGGS